MYLLDTNVLSELHKAIRGRGHPQVTVWLAAVDLATCFISAITLMEIEIGVLSMERRDVAQGVLLRAWFEQRVRPEFSGRVLAVDEAVARRCAHLHVPDPQPERDALIAATARVHELVVVTRNTRDFSGTGVLLLNPWESSAIHEAPAAYTS